MCKGTRRLPPRACPTIVQARRLALWVSMGIHLFLRSVRHCQCTRSINLRWISEVTFLCNLIRLHRRGFLSSIYLLLPLFLGQTSLGQGGCQLENLKLKFQKRKNPAEPSSHRARVSPRGHKGHSPLKRPNPLGYSVRRRAFHSDGRRQPID